jgi:hypothetical protein
MLFCLFELLYLGHGRLLGRLSVMSCYVTPGACGSVTARDVFVC